MAIKLWCKNKLSATLNSLPITYKRISPYTFIVGTLHIFIGNKKIEISSPDLNYPANIKKEMLLIMDVDGFLDMPLSFDKENKLMLLDNRIALKYEI